MDIAHCICHAPDPAEMTSLRDAASVLRRRGVVHGLSRSLAPKPAPKLREPEPPTGTEYDLAPDIWCLHDWDI